MNEVFTFKLLQLLWALIGVLTGTAWVPVAISGHQWHLSSLVGPTVRSPNVILQHNITNERRQLFTGAPWPRRLVERQAHDRAQARVLLWSFFSWVWEL